MNKIKHDQLLNQSEIIRKIESLGGQYNPTLNLSIDDQLLICEAVAESAPIPSDNFQQKETSNENGSVNGSGNENGSCKGGVNIELTPDKFLVISKLNDCTSKTPPKEIAQLLNLLFSEYGTKRGWWLYVSQQWNPRAINRVISKMLKVQDDGWKTIQNPAAYFTNLIKFRKKRRNL